MEEQNANDTPSDGVKDSGSAVHEFIGSVESALKGQASPAAAHVRRMRAKNPGLTPAGAVKKLERQLLATTTTSGVAVGATAAAPGVGDVVAAAFTLGGPAVSVSAAVFHILAVAEVHQMPMADIEHRRKLALSIFLEQGADTAIPKVAERTGQHLARKTLKAIPGSALKPFNDVLGRHFITKSGDKQGVIVLAKVLPYVMGAVIGGGYSFATAWSVILATRLAFGPPQPAFGGIADGGSP